MQVWARCESKSWQSSRSDYLPSECECKSSLEAVRVDLR